MRRALIVLVAALTLVAVGWMTLIGAALAWAGVAVVGIAAHGAPRLTVPLPMALVETAALAVDLGDGLEGELDPASWGPAVAGLAAVLDECPDATLVEVEDGSDRVLVEKRGGSLVIRVADGERDLEIVVPTRSARRLVARLAG